MELVVTDWSYGTSAFCTAGLIVR